MAFAPLAPGGYLVGTKENTRCQKGNVGWDVRAVQRELIALGHQLPRFGADGHYGEETVTAVTNYQKRKRLFVDGWAGPKTQQTLTLDVWWPIQAGYGIPPGLGRGQLGWESGLLPGNHSPARKQPDPARFPFKPDVNGHYFDNGVSQMASEYHNYEEAYHPQVALTYYAKRITAAHARYRQVGHVTDARRLWELAAGSWNRPAHANWLAGIRDGSASEPDADEREWLEFYIDHTTHLLTL